MSEFDVLVNVTVVFDKFHQEKCMEVFKNLITKKYLRFAYT